MSARLQKRAVVGAAGVPLSRVQKANVCRLAERAWKAKGMPFFADQDAMPPEMRLSKSQALETWRQEEQDHVTGKRSLRQCGQGDYCLLMEHFASLAGDFDQAGYWQQRGEGDDARRALHALRNAIAAAGVLGNATAYAGAIARDKFGTDRFGDLSAKQLWTLVFDLRRAAAGKRRRAEPVPRLPGTAADGEVWKPGGR